MFCTAFVGRKQTIYLTNFTYLLNNLTNEKRPNQKFQGLLFTL